MVVKRGGHDTHPLCAGLDSPAFNNDVDEMVFMSQVMLLTLSKFIELHCNARFLSPLACTRLISVFFALGAASTEMLRLHMLLEDHTTRSTSITLQETRMRLKCKDYDTCLLQRVEQRQEHCLSSPKRASRPPQQGRGRSSRRSQQRVSQ